MFEYEELEALLHEDCYQTQEELGESLGVTQAAKLSAICIEAKRRCEMICMSDCDW